MVKNIVFFELEGWEPEIINKELKGMELKYYEKTINEIDLREIKEAEVVSVFIYSHITKEIIDSLPNLKAIITRSTGYNHIDVEYATKKGIRVYYIPDYGTQTVAEFTLLLMLSILRKFRVLFIKYYIEKIIDPKLFRGEDLQQKTIGIVGTGRIGTKVIELLQPFNVKILAYNKHPHKEIEQKYNVKYVGFEELLKKSDIISFHVPLTPETYHMLNTNNIESVKKGAYIINTSRGAVIETEALIKALENKTLKGVALDVLEAEDIEHTEIDALLNLKNEDDLRKAIFASALQKYENVIITPHIAYDTEQAIKRIITTTLEIIKSEKENKIMERYLIN